MSARTKPEALKAIHDGVAGIIAAGIDLFEFYFKNGVCAPATPTPTPTPTPDPAKPSGRLPAAWMVQIIDGTFSLNVDGEERVWQLRTPPADIPGKCNGIARFRPGIIDYCEVHSYGTGHRLTCIGTATLVA